MKYTEKDLYDGMELLCIDNGGWDHWETGEIYTVTKSKVSGQLIIEGDETVGRTLRVTEEILQYLNNNKGMRLTTIDDQKEEEKEITKYAKITKYAGLIDTDKENGLEIGKEYEIVRFSSVSKDCWVYLNEKRPEYFITETQYELVEREYPVTEVKVDILAKLEAKIEQLTNEQEYLFNKRMRIKHQEEALREKRMKLTEAKKSLEFLKQQKFL